MDLSQSFLMGVERDFRVLGDIYGLVGRMEAGAVGEGGVCRRLDLHSVKNKLGMQTSLTMVAGVGYTRGQAEVPQSGAGDLHRFMNKS
jgi:hypothetical protein